VDTLLIRWAINAVALWIAVLVVPGIDAADDPVTLAATAVVFGLVNTLIRPILKLLTCPLILITLGLFTLVVNAAMLWLTGWIAGRLDLGFSVDGFLAALIGALVISVVSLLLSMVMTGERQRR
jgi:putative membrane protein